MPFLIPGRTICELCGFVIETEDDACAFAPFVVNEVDPLRVFHDGVFHRRCVAVHPMGVEATRWNAAVQDMTRACDVCSRPISSEPVLSMGFLTSNPDSPLYAFNGLRFHRDCLPHWRLRSEFCELLSEAMRTKGTKGKGINWLAAQVCMCAM